MLSLSLDVASVGCFAFASGMVFVLHFLEQPAYSFLSKFNSNTSVTTDVEFQLKLTKKVLGQFLAAGVPQIKAGLLVAGTICSVILVYKSGNIISLRSLLVLCGVIIIPIMAKSALPAAHRVSELSPLANKQ